MEASQQSVPELIAAAQTNAQHHYDQIQAVVAAASDAELSQAQRDQSRAETSAIELLAVDIFAVFESRMQHHFKRGPFSRKLHALLTGAGQPNLAYKIYNYYLAINVLKHGIGSSHRELLKSKTHLFVVRSTDEIDENGSLIDVLENDFFDGLTSSILDAYHFLER